MAERAGQEAIVAGKVDRGVKIAIQTKDVKLLVIFVLVNRLKGNLHYHVDNFRCFVPERQAYVINHGSSLSFPGLV